MIDYEVKRFLEDLERELADILLSVKHLQYNNRNDCVSECWGVLEEFFDRIGYDRIGIMLLNIQHELACKYAMEGGDL